MLGGSEVENILSFFQQIPAECFLCARLFSRLRLKKKIGKAFAFVDLIF